MSAYAARYTFTREQLAQLLDDVLHAARWRRLATDASGADDLHDLAWPKICAAVIDDTLNALAFDATRPPPDRETRHAQRRI